MEIAFKDQGGPDLGAECHQKRQGATPVWIVTDMSGEIILSNRVNYATTSSNSWVITSGRITISRFWSASTAMLVLAMQNESRDKDYPDLPGYVYRPLLGGKDNFGVTPPPLDKNDEICIWAGYIDNVRPAVLRDLLTHKLFRCFVGVIDTVVVSGTTNMGTTMMIQCRDRMKYLMDSLGTYNTTDSNYIRENKDAQLLRRPNVILEVAKRSIGNLDGAASINSGSGGNTVNEPRCDSVCGSVIEGGYVEDLTEGLPDSTGKEKAPPIEGFSNPAEDNAESIYNKEADSSRSYYGKELGAPFIGGVVTTPSVDLSAKNPLFNIITGRRPFNVNEESFAGMANQVTDRVALEFIKFLALQEPWPTEVFVDHRSGEFWYAPRELDLTGLEDPKRFYRTYVYREDNTKFIYEKNYSTTEDSQFKYIHPCQAMLLFREESSSINWRSNIIVQNQEGINQSSSQALHLKVVPPWLKGRRFACTYYTVTDKTIQDRWELVGTAMAFARLYGKELRAATMHIIGDPTMCPGEAVQVIGSPLNAVSKLSLEKDRADAVDQYSNMYKKMMEALKELQQKSPSVSSPPTTPTTPTPPTTPTAPTAPTPSTGSVTSPDETTFEPNETVITSKDENNNDVVNEQLKRVLQTSERVIRDILNSPSKISVEERLATFLADSLNVSKEDLPDALKSALEQGTLTQEEYAEKVLSGLYTEKTATSSTATQSGEGDKVITPSGAFASIIDRTGDAQYNAQLMCPYKFNNGNYNVGKIEVEEPKSIWRVEAVIHKFNENPGEGFKTEVALLAPT
jgi:hypothetical protein